ncbi:MAG: ribosomal L7Ae/L30e/S12e/Gadd45 family protein [Ruminococcus sp.]|nr:ribosomal L7Ae/L30e/S12e/Gadd45 family protein [Ruminococcus sp.]MDE6849363.1 ribosomal L7Ae/L30e/S12e/Gadd45 family protein [Ruminococcus sp.]MDE7137060.1 ribosomal L7Ae/L30e/S12e/Gadd45 family protein [Ruminococcus sp.]
MNSKKTANLLTICLKAGKTVKGFDSVCDTVKNGTAFCILTASDASEKTVKEISFICGKYSVPLFRTELTKEEIGILCGKITAVLAVCDKGFADGFAKMVNT